MSIDNQKNKLLKLATNYIVAAIAFQFCFLTFFLVLAFDDKINATIFSIAFTLILLVPLIVFVVITYIANKTKKEGNEQKNDKIATIYKKITLFFVFSIIGVILFSILSSCFAKLRQYTIVKKCPYVITNTSCGMFDCYDHSYCIYSDGTVSETKIPITDLSSKYEIIEASNSGYEGIIELPEGETFSEFISGGNNYIVTNLGKNSALYKYVDSGNLELITNKIPASRDYISNFFVNND